MEKCRTKLRKTVINSSAFVMSIIMTLCIFTGTAGVYSTTVSASETVFEGLPETKSYNAILNTDIRSKELHLNVDFTMDYSYIIDEDNIGNNKKYTRDMSKMMEMLAMNMYAGDSYHAANVEIKDGIESGFYNTHELTNPTTLYEALGFEDIQRYKTSEYTLNDDWSYDKDDFADFICGHKYIQDNDQRYDISFVSIKGCDGGDEEWTSNMDIGADTEEYKKCTGDHPMWTNKENHKGFDVAANKVIQLLEEKCLKSYEESDNVKKIILLTGHSRGAAIANLLGKYFEDKKEEYTSFTYTFATPNTTVSENASDCKTIFNVVNTDDIMTQMPFKAWGFTKYGQIESVSVSDKYEACWPFSAKKGTWERFTGLADYQNANIDRVLKKLVAVASTREELYEMDTSEDGYTDKESSRYSTYEEAEAFKETLAKELENEKLSRFCELSVVKKCRKFVVRVRYCPAYLMQVLSNLTTGLLPENRTVQSLLGRYVSGKYNTAKLAVATSSGEVKVLRFLFGGMEDPHTMATYYLIANNDFKSLKNLPY